MEKEEAALTGLEKGKLSRELPIPNASDAFSAHPFCILYGDARHPSSFTDTHAYGLFVQSIQTSQ